MSKPDGGQAFASGTHNAPGMSLRDYFAGQALAMLARQTLVGVPFQAIASDAYAIADALLAERSKGADAQ